MRHVKVTTYDGDKFIVTEEQAEGINQAITAKRSHVVLSDQGVTLAVASIKQMDMDYSSAPEGRLGDGTEVGVQRGRLHNSVRARWVKKRVSISQFEKLYANAPGYHRLATEDSAVWMAFTKIADGRPLPDDVYELDVTEAERLDRQLAVPQYAEIPDDFYSPEALEKRRAENRIKYMPAWKREQLEELEKHNSAKGKSKP